MSPEKITLKPIAKELLFKNNEEDTYFDVFSYNGTTNQEKSLGSLFIVSHVKFGEEDMSYLVSLVSSLAKREYYSAESMQEQDSKKAFENTLKKLNEVLEDFFKTKKFKLNIGLAAISGEMIYISRLGKFKVALARNNDYIDILNNLMLFNKDTDHATQFSNIISGRIQPGDKIFAYFPAKGITTREKQLNPIFVKSDEGAFSEKLATLADNPTFSCCGIYITIQQSREIPIQAPNGYQRMAPVELAQEDAQDSSSAVLAQAESTDIKSLGKKSEEEEKVEESDNDEVSPVETKPEVKPTSSPMPTTIRAELSVGKRSSILSSAANRLGKIGSINRFKGRNKVIAFLTLAGIIVIPITAWTIFHNAHSAVNAAYNKANDNISLAESKLNQKDLKSARSFFQAAILELATIDTKQAQAMKGDVQQKLDSIDHVSNTQPQLNTDNSIDTTQLFANIVPNALKDEVGTNSAAIYEDNLYVLLSDNITVSKYTDATKGGTKSTSWGTLESPASTIAVDGNLYAVDQNGMLSEYFKGKKENQNDLNLSLGNSLKLFTGKDNPNIYLTDFSNKLVYVIDKASMTIKVTYRLDTVGEVKDTSILSDGTIWILSGDGKIWKI